MVGEFAGKTAVVTGACGDIGAAISRELASQGATVWGFDLRVDGVATPTEIGSGSFRHAQLDVTDSEAVNDAFLGAEQQSGPIELLVNCAGGPGRERTSLDKVSDEAWRAVTTLNLDGVFFCCRAAATSMKLGGGGSIVNISSGAGRTYSRTGVQAYAAAKAGVIGLTRQLARELGEFGVRVNCAAPGFIFAQPTREEWARMSEEEQQRLVSGVSLGRIGEAADLVGPVLFFLSDAAGFVSGQTISVDGGSIMLG